MDSRFIRALFSCLIFAGWSHVYGQARVTYRVVNNRGKPVAGAWLYDASFPIHLTVGSPLGGDAGLMGVSDRRGCVRYQAIDGASHRTAGFLLAMNRDGRVAFAKAGRTVEFGPTADMQLRFLDGHGKPIADRFVNIFPTDEVFPVKGYGVDRITTQLPPKLDRRLCGFTDRRGRILFRKLPKGRPFCVDLDATDDMVDPVALAGAVWPGKPVTIRVPRDLQIIGTVIQVSTGKPVSGVLMSIRYLGAIDRTFKRAAITNAAGQYRFTGLPACEYHLSVGSAGDEEPIWIEVGNHSNIGRNNLVALKTASGRCDIKVAKAATVKITTFDVAGKATFRLGG